MMVVVIILCLLAFSAAAQDAYGPMSDERVVFEIPQGEIEFGFYPELAPVTSAHIFELCTLGLYTGKSNDHSNTSLVTRPIRQYIF